MQKIRSVKFIVIGVDGKEHEFKTKSAAKEFELCVQVAKVLDEHGIVESKRALLTVDLTSKFMMKKRRFPHAPPKTAPDGGSIKWQEDTQVLNACKERFHSIVGNVGTGSIGQLGDMVRWLGIYLGGRDTGRNERTGYLKDNFSWFV